MIDRHERRQKARLLAVCVRGPGGFHGEAMTESIATSTMFLPILVDTFTITSAVKSKPVWDSGVSSLSESRTDSLLYLAERIVLYDVRYDSSDVYDMAQSPGYTAGPTGGRSTRYEILLTRTTVLIEQGSNGL